MRRVSFRLPADEKEELLDALMPLLPAGVRERPLGTAGRADHDRRRAARARGARGGRRPHPRRLGLRRRARRTGASGARCSAAGVLVAGRMLVRSPGDPPAGRGCSTSCSSAAAAGSDPARTRRRACASSCCSSSTRRAARPTSAAARHARDRGCPARLGSRGRGRPDGRRGLRRTRERRPQRRRRRLAGRRSRVGRVPLAALLLVNAPPPVHERVAAALALPAGDREPARH